MQTSLAPIATFATGGYAVLASAALPASSVGELIAYARQHPGKVNFASPGTGSSNHLVGELFKTEAKVDVVHVPYKGAAPAMVAMMADESQVLFEPPISALPATESRKVKILAVTSQQRMPGMAAVPTVAESGLPGFSATWFQGLFAPAGTPRPVLGKLYADMTAVLQQPEVRHKLHQLGAEVGSDKPGEFAARIARDIRTWSEVAKAAGVEPE